MTSRSKAIGLSLVVSVMSAVAAINASATSGGHFILEAANATITASEHIPDKLHFKPHPGSDSERVGCGVATYHGVATSTTVSEIEVTPSYSECSTTDGSGTPVTIDHNGCKYQFTVSPGGTNGTFAIVCKVGANIVITHPNCTVTVRAQSNLQGVHYTTLTEPNTKHVLTVDVNVTPSSEYHGGICVFLGTNHAHTLIGSIILRADVNGQRIHLTTT